MPKSKRIQELCRLINKANAKYYNGTNVGGVEDETYDQWKDDLAKLVEPNHPLLTKVGDAPPKDSLLEEGKHTAFMGSQNKASDVKELEKWYKAAGSPVVYVTYKVDGASLCTYYSSSRIKQVLTRGDGETGQDVTMNVIRFQDFPISVNISDFNGAVRGEGILYTEDWKKQKPDMLSNARNVGTGNILESSGRGCDRMHFLAFNVESQDRGIKTEEQKIALIQSLGFETMEGKVCKNFQEIIEYHSKTQADRPKLPYGIDGIVIKINDLAKQGAMGFSDNNTRPKGQISFKFVTEKAQTKIKEVVLTIGHTGAIIPTAILEPVRLAGTTVTNALLCNWDNINDKLDVAIGDTVIVHKAGDIIPQIIEVVERPKSRVLIPEPKECPVCGSKATRHKNVGGDEGANVFCDNPDCEAKSLGKVKRWIKSLDIKEFGDELLATLMDLNYVENVADIYTLKNGINNGREKETLGSLMINGRNFGDKRAETVLEEIEKTKELTIDQFLGSLGIKHLGTRMVEKIRKNAADRLAGQGPAPLDCIDTWIEQTESIGGKAISFLERYAEELGIPNIAKEIFSGIQSQKKMIRELLDKHITVTIPKEKKMDNSLPLAGKIFCLTGTMSRDRKEIAVDIEKAGGGVEKDVRSNVTHLVQADPAIESNKSEKANKKGIPIISEEELMSMISG